jgi:hypothetical protein
MTPGIERPRGLRWWLALCAGGALFVAGCERGAPSAAGSSAAAAADPAAAESRERSPKRVLEELIALRAARRFDEMDDHIAPPHGPTVVNLLLAVEEFLAANQRLGEYLREHVGIGIAQRVDQSGLGNYLDIFSPHVTLLDEEIRGAEAVIPYTVDGALPTREARVLRIDGVWKYDAGTGNSAELPAAFRRMARGLDETLEDLVRGQLTANQIRADPRRLMGLVAERLRPGILLLPPGPDDPAEGAPR